MINDLVRWVAREEEKVAAAAAAAVGEDTGTALQEVGSWFSSFSAARAGGHPHRLFGKRGGGGFFAAAYSSSSCYHQKQPPSPPLPFACLSSSSSSVLPKTISITTAEKGGEDKCRRKFRHFWGRPPKKKLFPSSFFKKRRRKSRELLCWGPTISLGCGRRHILWEMGAWTEVEFGPGFISIFRPGFFFFRSLVFLLPPPSRLGEGGKENWIFFLFSYFVVQKTENGTGEWFFYEGRKFF